MATTKLDIAQGKARKNSAVATHDSAAGAEGDTMKASAASKLGHHVALRMPPRTVLLARVAEEMPVGR